MAYTATSRGARTTTTNRGGRTANPRGRTSGSSIITISPSQRPSSNTLNSRFQSIVQERRQSPHPRSSAAATTSSTRPDKVTIIRPSVGGPRSRGASHLKTVVSRIQKPARKPRNHPPAKMDIDQGPAIRISSSLPAATRGRSRTRGRGGRGRRPANQSRRDGSVAAPSSSKSTRPLSREMLDNDLDSFMMQDAKTAKYVLDTDMEAYMAGSLASAK